MCTGSFSFMDKLHEIRNQIFRNTCVKYRRHVMFMVYKIWVSLSFLNFLIFNFIFLHKFPSPWSPKIRFLYLRGFFPYIYMNSIEPTNNRLEQSFRWIEGIHSSLHDMHGWRLLSWKWRRCMPAIWMPTKQYSRSDIWSHTTVPQQA